MKSRIWKILLLLLWVWMVPVYAQEQDELVDSYLEELDMQEIEKAIVDMLPEMDFNFRDAVMKLIKGEMPLNWDSVQKIISDTLFAELRMQRKIVVQILILAVTAAVFSNFIQIFGKNQISDISFYIIYLMLFLLLMNAFWELKATAQEAMGEILHFMKLLLPVYLVVSSLAAGSVTAIGFYELTLVFITAVQTLMIYVVLPGTGFYVLFLLLNHLGREDYLSKLADLLKTVISWMMKTMLALVIGIQTIQNLLLPAIDSLKNSLWTKAAGVVPVLGNTLSAVTESVLGTAVLLKNAVGVAGLLVIAIICLIPVIRLAVCTLLYKIAGVAVQPVSDKRITDCISGVGEGVMMLLKAVLATGVMFLITLAMVTASLR